MKMIHRQKKGRWAILAKQETNEISRADMTGTLGV